MVLSLSWGVLTQAAAQPSRSQSSARRRGESLPIPQPPSRKPTRHGFRVISVQPVVDGDRPRSLRRGPERRWNAPRRTLRPVGGGWCGPPTFEPRLAGRKSRTRSQVGLSRRHMSTVASRSCTSTMRRRRAGTKSCRNPWWVGSRDCGWEFGRASFPPRSIPMKTNEPDWTAGDSRRAARPTSGGRDFQFECNACRSFLMRRVPPAPHLHALVERRRS